MLVHRHSSAPLSSSACCLLWIKTVRVREEGTAGDLEAWGAVLQCSVVPRSAGERGANAFGAPGCCMLLLEPCSPRLLSVCCWPGGSSHKYVSLHRDLPARGLYSNSKVGKVPTCGLAHTSALARACVASIPIATAAHNRRSHTLEITRMQVLQSAFSTIERFCRRPACFLSLQLLCGEERRGVGGCDGGGEVRVRTRKLHTCAFVCVQACARAYACVRVYKRASVC
jgi:hypothetical protein